MFFPTDRRLREELESGENDDIISILTDLMHYYREPQTAPCHRGNDDVVGILTDLLMHYYREPQTASCHREIERDSEKERASRMEK